MESTGKAEAIALLPCVCFSWQAGHGNVMLSAGRCQHSLCLPGSYGAAARTKAPSLILLPDQGHRLCLELLALEASLWVLEVIPQDSTWNQLLLRLWKHLCSHLTVYSPALSAHLLVQVLPDT